MHPVEWHCMDVVNAEWIRADLNMNGCKSIPGTNFESHPRGNSRCTGLESSLRCFHSSVWLPMNSNRTLLPNNRTFHFDRDVLSWRADSLVLWMVLLVYLHWSTDPTSTRSLEPFRRWYWMVEWMFREPSFGNYGWSTRHGKRKHLHSKRWRR